MHRGRACADLYQWFYSPSATEILVILQCAAQKSLICLNIASRVQDFPELEKIRGLLSHKFGREYVEKASSDLSCRQYMVNENLIRYTFLLLHMRRHTRLTPPSHRCLTVRV